MDHHLVPTLWSRTVRDQSVGHRFQAGFRVQKMGHVSRPIVKLCTLWNVAANLMLLGTPWAGVSRYPAEFKLRCRPAQLRNWTLQQTYVLTNSPPPKQKTICDVTLPPKKANNLWNIVVF